MINKAAINGVLGKGSIWQEGNKFFNGSVGLIVPDSAVGDIVAEFYRQGRAITENEILAPEFWDFHKVNRQELERHFAKGATRERDDRLALRCVALYPDAVVSADGYWLALSRVAGCEVPVLAPPQVKHFLKMAAGDLEVSVIENNQCWRVGDWELRVTVDATYPDYMQVIPRSKEGHKWTGLQMTWAHKLPKKEVGEAIVKLGGAWPMKTGMALAPIYLRKAADFLGCSDARVSIGHWERNAYESECCEEYATITVPLRIENGSRECVCMPCHIMAENQRFVTRRQYSTPDPVIPGLYWK